MSRLDEYIAGQAAQPPQQQAQAAEQAAEYAAPPLPLAGGLRSFSSPAVAAPAAQAAGLGAGAGAGAIAGDTFPGAPPPLQHAASMPAPVPKVKSKPKAKKASKPKAGKSKAKKKNMHLDDSDDWGPGDDDADMADSSSSSSSSNSNQFIENGRNDEDLDYDSDDGGALYQLLVLTTCVINSAYGCRYEEAQAQAEGAAGREAPEAVPQLADSGSRMIKLGARLLTLVLTDRTCGLACIERLTSACSSSVRDKPSI